VVVNIFLDRVVVWLTIKQSQSIGKMTINSLNKTLEDSCSGDTAGGSYGCEKSSGVFLSEVLS
jgi:hypothetical protein